MSAIPDIVKQRREKFIENFKRYNLPVLEKGQVYVCANKSDKTGLTTMYHECSADIDKVIKAFIERGGSFLENGSFVEVVTQDMFCNYITFMLIMNVKDIPESFRPEKVA